MIAITPLLYLRENFRRTQVLGVAKNPHYNGDRKISPWAHPLGPFISSFSPSLGSPPSSIQFF